MSAVESSTIEENVLLGTNEIDVHDDRYRCQPVERQ